ncbi:hypothetical protein GF336_02195 [Candidatus Woesearchaeota archaeon]|nr:hypothetical protein [Candidatus Woesearchaeota archaeon]
MIVFRKKKNIKYAVYDMLEEKRNISYMDELEESIKGAWDVEYREHALIDRLYSCLYEKKHDKELDKIIKTLKPYLVCFK